MKRKVEKELGEATVKSKKKKEGRKVCLCTPMVELSPKDIWAKLLDTDNLSGQVQNHKEVVQVTAEGGGVVDWG